MTGRELIIHILNNNLEDEPIFKDGKLTGFVTIGEAAEKLEVGAATILTWLNLGYLNCIVLGNMIFIPETLNIVKTEDRHDE